MLPQHAYGLTSSSGGEGEGGGGMTARRGSRQGRDNISGHYSAVFVATKLGILSENMIFY